MEPCQAVHGALFRAAACRRHSCTEIGEGLGIAETIDMHGEFRCSFRRELRHDVAHCLGRKCCRQLLLQRGLLCLREAKASKGHKSHALRRALRHLCRHLATESDIGESAPSGHAAILL